MTRPRQIHVLLLSESESMAALDRRALREVGADRVEGLTSGVAAARILAGLDEAPPSFQPDVVVCSQRLSDMEGEQFCAILRLHPMLLDMPVLLILPHDSEVEQLRTLGCGASALLARPYSIDQLKAHLDFLISTRPTLDDLDKASQLTTTKAFDDALATYGILLKPIRQPEDYFRVGMQCLEQRKWNSAINAFQRAMRGALIQGKAELGMAAAWKGKGDMARYKYYLSQAAATFVRARQWNRARAVYGRMLQEDPNARSPFLSEALQQMRQGHADLFDRDHVASDEADEHRDDDRGRGRDDSSRTLQTALHCLVIRITQIPVLLDPGEQEYLVVHCQTETEGNHAGDDERLQSMGGGHAEVAVVEDPGGCTQRRHQGEHIDDEGLDRHDQ